MTRALFIDADTGTVTETSPAEFYKALFGKYPRTPEQRKADADAYWAEREKKDRAELEAIRDRICEKVKPELAAKFRKGWAELDAQRAARKFRRAA